MNTRAPSESGAFFWVQWFFRVLTNRMDTRDVIELCSAVGMFLLGMLAQFRRVDVGAIRRKLEIALAAIEALQAVVNGLSPQVSVPDKVGLSKPVES